MQRCGATWSVVVRRFELSTTGRLVTFPLFFYANRLLTIPAELAIRDKTCYTCPGPWQVQVLQPGRRFTRLSLYCRQNAPLGSVAH